MIIIDPCESESLPISLINIIYHEFYNIFCHIALSYHLVPKFLLMRDDVHFCTTLQKNLYDCIRHIVDYFDISKLIVEFSFVRD